MSNPNTNSFRLVGAGKTFISPTDFIVQVDTSAGAVTLVLPKISTILDSYTTIYQYVGIRVVDISNNASVNNITIEGFETNVVNSSSSVVLNTNGAGGICTLIGDNQWSFNSNSVSGGNSSSSTLVIDGDVNDFFKYGNVSNILNSQVVGLTQSIIINNIQGTTNINITDLYLTNLTITNSTILQLTLFTPQLKSLNLISGLEIFQFGGVIGINNERFGLISAPDLTPSENTLNYIVLSNTLIQFTDANYFQINNVANIYFLSLFGSVQINNTLPLGLFDNLTGLNSDLDLSQMNLQDIPLGLFSFLGTGNQNLQILLQDNALTQTAIDNIITDCLDRATNNGATSILLDMTGGTNATPSAQALLDIATLIGTYAWTISYNP